MSELHGEAKKAKRTIKSNVSLSKESQLEEPVSKKVTSTDRETDSKRKRKMEYTISSYDPSDVVFRSDGKCFAFHFRGEGHTVGHRVFFQKLEIISGNGDPPDYIEVGDSVILFDLKDHLCPFPCSLPIRTVAPYVGRVEGLYYDLKDPDPKRLKFQCRWYYKRDDIHRMKKSYCNIPRSKLLGFMTNQDLLLGTVTDDCPIRAINKKCSVIQSTAFKRNEPHDMPPEPAYRCCFDITVDRSGVVNATAYDGPDDVYESISPTKRIKTEDDKSQESDDGSMQSYDVGSGGGRETKSTGSDDDNSSMDESVKPPRTPVISEGTTMHKITVGDQHQAIIPSLGDNSVRRSREIPPEMVWEPNKISDSEYEKYMEEAAAILKGHMEYVCNMLPTRHVPHNLDLKHIRLPHMHYREFNVDQILKVLHDKAYNTHRALKAIKKSPKTYLFIWTKEEKVLYDIGFKSHYNAIRFITKGIGGNKNHKDVVDYFYRFKIPDQFRSYQDQKRDQAKRILECVEKHRRDEYLSPECTVPTSGIGTKKLPQIWIRTGGGDSNDVGAIERRRQDASDLLNDAKDALGPEKYLDLVNLLKALNSRVLTIPEVRDGFAQLLESDRNNLLERFENFLPKQFRT